MKNKTYFIVTACLILLCVSCGERSVPKPRGYFRIALPDTTYAQLSMLNVQFSTFPYTFELSEHAKVNILNQSGEKYWIDIIYPAFDARIHCSYHTVDGKLRELSDDAQKFVYHHASQASSIPEQGFANDDERVYGVFYELVGNTASPFQFYVTDSTRHFFRGAVYFNCVPNQDSLAPVINYLEHDVRYLMETFQWK